MNIYKRLFIILLSVFPFTANAIISIPDCMIIDGKVHELYDYPLEKNTELAQKLREILPEKVTLDGKVWEHTYTTSCSRGYVATWEIADNKLFLRTIKKTGEIKIMNFENISNENSYKENTISKTKNSIKQLVSLFDTIIKLYNSIT